MSLLVFSIHYCGLLCVLVVQAAWLRFGGLAQVWGFGSGDESSMSFFEIWVWCSEARSISWDGLLIL